MPPLAKALAALALSTAWLDGEIVVLDDAGLPDFGALQNAFDKRTNDDIVYFVFDLPYLDGVDLRRAALRERKRLLQSVLDAAHGGRVRYCTDVEAEGADIVQAAREMKLEGVIAKRIDAPYISQRSDAWLKLKCRQRQEFVVCGYTDRSDGAKQVGSLLLGVRDGRDLKSVGRVGTGWSADTARRLYQLLSKERVDECPFDTGSPAPGRWSRATTGEVHWVKPQRVAEVEFANWTADGQVRQASYIALRSDKEAGSVIRETPQDAGVRVTHPQRIVDASSGATKLDLVRYYESIAERMLPHLTGRPLSLLRAPHGIAAKTFFQKHDSGDAASMYIDSVDAIGAAAQLNAVEFHTVNATRRHPTKPDRMVFDLDPGEGVGWPQVREAALLVRTLLDELGLASWLKTSGGKGLHVVVPLKPTRDFAAARDFSKQIVEHLARTVPSRFVAKSGPKNRVGRIFVDYLRNGDGATTAAAFSARARPGLGVSMPLAWDDLNEVKRGDQWTIFNARDHLSFQRADPWAAYWSGGQTLSAAMKTLRSASKGSR